MKKSQLIFLCMLTIMWGCTPTPDLQGSLSLTSLGKEAMKGMPENQDPSSMGIMMHYDSALNNQLSTDQIQMVAFSCCVCKGQCCACPDTLKKSSDQKFMVPAAIKEVKLTPSDSATTAKAMVLKSEPTEKFNFFKLESIPPDGNYKFELIGTPPVSFDVIIIDGRIALPNSAGDIKK